MGCSVRRQASLCTLSSLSLGNQAGFFLFYFWGFFSPSSVSPVRCFWLVKSLTEAVHIAAALGGGCWHFSPWIVGGKVGDWQQLIARGWNSERRLPRVCFLLWKTWLVEKHDTCGFSLKEWQQSIPRCNCPGINVSVVWAVSFPGLYRCKQMVLYWFPFAR